MWSDSRKDSGVTTCRNYNSKIMNLTALRLELRTDCYCMNKNYNKFMCFNKNIAEMCKNVFKKYINIGSTTNSSSSNKIRSNK